MPLLYPIVAFVGGLMLSLLTFRRRYQNRITELEKKCMELSYQVKELGETKEELKLVREEVLSLRVKEGELEAHLEERKKSAEEKLAMLAATQEKLTHTFKALSTEALEKSNHSFLQLAKETLKGFQEAAKGDLDKKHQSIEAAFKPVRESLSKLDQGMQKIEKERRGDQESLRVQLKAMMDAEKELRTETSTLVHALKAPMVRGRWGEMQLRRVVELAGMVNHCDFYEQETADGGQVRPDMVIRLPGEKQVIVDAKTPCISYLEAIQAQSPEVKERNLKEHARHVRQHVIALGKKEYWQKFEATPEFVVLFIPSDNFFSSALEYDPSLIEVGVEQGVVIATPTTLIGLLRAIAYGWKQEKLSKHAQEVSLLGHELYKRILAMGKHWNRMGKSLSNAVDSYNQAVGSLESRVLVTARKFQDLGAASRTIELDPLEGVDLTPKKISAEDMDKK